MGKKCPLKIVALAVDEKEKAIKSSWVDLRAGGYLQGSGIVAWRKIYNIKNEQQQQNKNLLEVLPSKYHRWKFLMIICDLYK